VSIPSVRGREARPDLSEQNAMVINLETEKSGKEGRGGTKSADNIAWIVCRQNSALDALGSRIKVGVIGVAVNLKH